MSATGPLPINGSVEIPEAELSWRFSRSSGPGGQNVNKTSSAAELLFDLAGSESLSDVQKERALERLSSRLVDGVLTIRAEEYRSQLRNREAARVRLAALIRESIAPPPRKRRPTKPSRGAVERRIQGKKHRSQIKANRRGDF